MPSSYTANVGYRDPVAELYVEQWTSTTASSTLVTPYYAWSESYGTSGYSTCFTTSFTTSGDGWYELGYIDGVVERSLEAHQDEVDRRIAQQATERRERKLQRAEARVAAEALLVSILTDVQRVTYAANGYFEVIGSCGGIYRIDNLGSSGNVHWMVDGRPAAQLCAHPDMREGLLPQADVMLGQMLAITTDEAAYVRAANVHSGRRPDHDGLTRVRAA